MIAPIWGRFLNSFPDVHLELQVGEAPVDIVAKGFDAGIGTHDRADIDMIAVRVTAPVKLAAVGSPGYFARRRKPQSPEDLVHHACVQYRLGADGSVLDWPFERNGKSHKIAVAGRVMVNSPELAVRAAIDGLGGEEGFGTLQQNYLEEGNVQAVTELSSLIAAQRAYEMNSKVISAADQMMQSTTQIMR